MLPKCQVFAIRMLILVTGWLSLGDSYRPGPCGRGTYLSMRYGCVPCPKDTFMGSDHHQNRHCKNCSRPDFGKKQSVETPCTSTTDAKLGCLSGYQDHGHIDGDHDPHGNNDPDCGPNGAVHTQVTAVPENKATASPGSVTGELNLTPASNYSLNNVTTLDIGPNLLPLYIILPFVICGVICLAVVIAKKKWGKMYAKKETRKPVPLLRSSEMIVSQRKWKFSS